ncbi:amidohydrolase [Muricauda sp. SCSIO 64092]|uniref:amidohydrolase family protein n=1 Tax=Allomuricauda sp. SCSIO 64092 TaxID=2908842 RepID=UPI001FF169F2|nr:amidohydrolase family protein [Muricauda sp. SCSIO 64092]UOY05382.1 amidohydrolase [Muricauda sp. SCSIO 64092]
MANNTGKKKPLINCHAHIFTGDYVPPLLGKGILPPLISWVAHLKVFIWVMRYIVMPIRWPDPNRGTVVDKITYQIKQLRKWLYDKYTFFPIVPRIAEVIQFMLVLPTLFIVLCWFDKKLRLGDYPKLQSVNGFLELLETVTLNLLPELLHQIIFILIVLFFLKVTRNLAYSILRKIVKLPGKFNRALFVRYLQMAEFAKYKNQFDILDRLKDQYPTGTQFVVLPMDMKFMKAGGLVARPKEYKNELKDLRGGDVEGYGPYSKNRLLLNKQNYLLQMEKLRDLKETRGDEIHPFVFLHPQRLRQDQKNTANNPKQLKPYFDFNITEEGKVELKDCWLKRYLEPEDSKLKFSGFKIYPALGYYPFDIELLPLWKYAVDHKIPIMTHCTTGTIFYRGWKKRSWNRHPVYYMGNSATKKLRLSATRSRNYQRYFTHPLNFLCLLHPELFQQLLNNYHVDKNVTQEQKQNLIKLFGEPWATEGLKNNLSELKICFGHYGGLAEWKKYLVADRNPHSNQLFKRPAFGSALAHKVDSSELSWYNARAAWEEMDWYTMITSLMLQYPNVYADISYMLHDESIFPLLKQTLGHNRGEVKTTPPHLSHVKLDLPKHPLGSRILYGTDFYMVRSHKTEKDLLGQTQALLSEEEFDLIARSNPKSYLNIS